MRMIDVALQFQALGVPVFPCKVGQKQPAIARGVNGATLDIETILWWWGESSAQPADGDSRLIPGLSPCDEYNVGLAMGHGLIAIDIDGAEGETNFKAWLAEAGIQLPKAPLVRTPGRGGGFHLYFRKPAGEEIRKRKLCDGADLYGLGVYLVAPGSTHPDGPKYQWGPSRSPDDLDFPELPAAIWREDPNRFEAMFGTINLNEIDDEKPTITEAIISACEEALTKAISEAYPGNRSNSCLWLSCQLRDNFLDQHDAREWIRRFHGSIDNKDFSIGECLATLRSAYKRKPRDPWKRVDNAAEAQHAPAQTIPSQLKRVDPLLEPAKPQKYIPCSEFAGNAPDTSYCIKNILPARGSAMMFGDSNVGKSFLALDMAMHVALGIDWFGHRTRPKPVLYFAGEGINGMKARARAWLDHHGQQPPQDLHFWPWPISMTDPASTMQHARRMAEELKNPPELIIIDTLAANFGAGDENKQEDMNRAVAGLQMFERNACVLVVHHTSKANNAAARGSTVLQGHVDVAISLSRKSLMHPVCVFMDKVRDGSKGHKYWFNIQGAATPWTDEDGDPIRSAVVDPADDPTSELTSLEAACLGKLRGLTDDQPNQRVQLSVWYREIRAMVSDSSNRNRTKKSLASKGKIGYDEDLVWLL